MRNQAKQFDYIIIGAGSAGCVLAGRLSEDRSVRVLIIEAGGRDRDPLIHIPVGIGKIGLGSRSGAPVHDWGYATEPDPGIDNRSIEARRGKVLGGSSSVNVMAYVRGNPADFDRWAGMGLQGWSYKEVLPYFKRAETFEGGEDAWRGGQGPLGVTLAKTPDPLFPAMIEAGRAAGFPVTSDYNGAQQEGFGRSQMTIWNGRRCSASVAYLRPALRRRNLTLVLKAMATRLIFERGRAIGVEYRKGGKTVRVFAEREAVLCGGVFNTPQLLMLSGVGDAQELRQFGVSPQIDLPGVGKNLQDHPAATLRWIRKAPGPFHRQMRADRMAVNLAAAYLFGKGPATYLPGGAFAFVKTRPELEIPDIQFLFPASPSDVHLWLSGCIAPYVDGFGVRPCLLRPKSRGEVKLASADPFARVRIRQNFFSEQEDLITLREGCKIAREVVSQAPLDSYRDKEQIPGSATRSDPEIDAWIRRTATTSSHPSCTCAMGVGEEAVLDASLRVRGVEGLRVVDASAMPDIVSGNLNACVIMMAEKAADMILGRTPPSEARLKSAAPQQTTEMQSP